MNALIDQLGRERRQFVLYKLVPRENGKTDKIPCSPLTGDAIDAQDSANWLSGPEAELWAASWGVGYGVGIVIFRGCGLFAIDFDACREPSGGWQPHVAALLQWFPEAYHELSVSGTGAHVLGTYHGELPDHRTRNADFRTECYSEARFIALGTHISGSVLTDCTDALLRFLAAYFPPREAEGSAEWTDGPCAGWRGPADDGELIRRAMQSTSAAAVFGHGASFAALWLANTDVLGRAYPPQSAGQPYDASAADLAIANMLAWWTGNHAERIERLMLGSALRRSKWETRPGYLRGTILRACASQTQWYNGPGDPEPASAPTVPTDAPAPIAPTATAVSASVPAPPATQVSPGYAEMPMNAARTFIDAFFKASGLQEIHYWQGAFMTYAGGIYAAESEDAMQSRAWKFFEHAGGGVPLKSRQVNEIIKALEALTYLPEKTPLPCWLDAPTVELPDLLICQNGAFDLTTGKHHALTPNLFATIRLPVDYLPNAPEPAEWIRFLQSLWPDDQESIDTLQEISGLLLTPITRFQKVFLIVGPKRSGKGTILRTMRRLLGSDNVASPALSTLARQYGCESLIGKLAALIGDARIKARSSEMPIVVERLLSISGEDSPNIERKYRPDWTGRLPTRVVMSSNELPHLDDPSGAMASRFVILKLMESFYGREDLDLEMKLTPEMPGILNWSIEGRRRLLKRGRFVQPAAGAALVEQMGELSSSVAKFVREHCTVGPELRVAKDALYIAWQTWCATNGEKPTADSLFARDLIAAYPKVKPARPRDPVTGKPTQMYEGIGLTNPPTGFPVPTPADSKVQEFAQRCAAAPLPPGAVPC